MPYVTRWVSGENASFLALGFPKEEDPNLTESKTQKPNKVAIVRMRRKKVKEENEDDEEDEAEWSSTSLRSPRVRRKPRPYSKTGQLRRNEHTSILESNLSTPTAKIKSSRWSMTEFRQCLCSCCHEKPVEENKASDSKERRDPDKNEKGVTGSINEQGRQEDPGGSPREGLDRSQKSRV